MNRFAEIKYGRINDIIETINDLDWVRTIFLQRLYGLILQIC